VRLKRGKRQSLASGTNGYPDHKQWRDEVERIIFIDLSFSVVSITTKTGFALQEHGCIRYTDNVDLIVPNIAHAVAALLSSGFQPHGSSQAIVVDRETGSATTTIFVAGQKVSHPHRYCSVAAEPT
jgi:hypothetical protein